MSKTTQIIIWIIVAIIVIGGIWWWWMASRPTPLTNINPGGPMIPASSTSASDNSQANSAIVSNGTSDAELDQDMANINAQMNGLASDSTNVDQSVNASNQ